MTETPAPGLAPGDHECGACGGTGAVTELISQGRPRYYLERGARKRELMIELARGETSRTDLARRHGVHIESIRAFAKRHAVEIAAIVQGIEDEFSGMWIAQKAARLAELQQDAEDAMAVVEKILGGLGQPAEDDPADPGGIESEGTPDLETALAWVKLKQSALRAAAEELGQIPNRVRMDVGGKIATYRIEGVDLDKV